MHKLKNLWAEYNPEIILIPLIFIADRLSKIWALNVLRLKESMEVFPFFRLTYVENTGAAFGAFQNGNYVLMFMAFIILFLLIKWRKDFLKYGPPARYALIFIMAGAAGNLYDRMVLGYVVDYFDFIIYPVFNIADSFITVGAALLAFVLVKESFFSKREEGK